jgi:hypothetical protein
MPPDEKLRIHSPQLAVEKGPGLVLGFIPLIKKFH